MKIINVKENCIIDRKNIAKVQDREIAVSVTSVKALNGDESGFINFTLGINDAQYCCEYFGTYLFKDKKQDLFYVDRIEFDVKLSEEELKALNEEYKECFKHEDILCVKIYDNEQLIATAIAFNQHNGYYSHVVEALENGQILYENWL